LGIDVLQPRLGWKLISEQKNTVQTAYEIRVGNSSKSILSGKELVWKSGKISSSQSIHIPYSGTVLQPKKRYYWQVRVWDNHGNTSAWSEVKFWETGLMNNSHWTAKWIEAEDITNGKAGPAPMFFK